ncbi:MAG: GTP 3',8-cyclase MoaA [Oscillospiraceae bacterium]|jgi:cyclic pyranopterin phosphate synthase
MRDGLERTIDYLRVSVTDRCDLRCVYCMPEEGVKALDHGSLLSYEEIMRLARIFASLGIKKIRLTGGEPLVRKDIHRLVAELKSINGIKTVVMTTNGTLLEENLPELICAGLDGVNISIDAIDEDVFRRITRRSGVDRVRRSIEAAVASPGLRVKLNCVPTELNITQLVPLARFAGELGVPLRFIELMPIGEGKSLKCLREAEVRSILTGAFGDLKPAQENIDPREKCRYFVLPGGGKVGFISALSHRFCQYCDRVRLTAEGFLKTCLQYDRGLALKPLLGVSDEEIREEIIDAVRTKPAGHHFGSGSQAGDEKRIMSQIGG